MIFSMFCKKQVVRLAVTAVVTCGTYLTLPSIANAAAPLCEYPELDLDGDGWSWENNRSCVIDGRQPVKVIRTINYCVSTASDDDSDGWGWENNRSCKVGPDTVKTDTPKDDNPTVTKPPVTTGSGRPECQSANADPDGDGWGWENNKTCLVKKGVVTTVTKPTVKTVIYCTEANADKDGDGWGWENNRSCVVNKNESDGKGSSTTFKASDITDLILITGQSNTVGSNSSYNSNDDGPHPRVFAYTSDGWQVAELYQSWDNRHPGTGNRSDTDRIHNNFALHFGKRLAELDKNKVVGFLLVSEPGKGISYWNPDAPGMLRVKEKTLAAINALPHKSSIDGVLWHQGETDWLFKGTSDRDVTESVSDNYYPTKLDNLINNLRLENWYDDSKPFICGETISATGVNKHLTALNSDSDAKTGCVEGEGLASIKEGGNHFNAESLRTIGKRYADAYIDLQ